jgi:hypothetical protein
MKKMIVFKDFRIKGYMVLLDSLVFNANNKCSCLVCMYIMCGIIRTILICNSHPSNQLKLLSNDIFRFNHITHICSVLNFLFFFLSSLFQRRIQRDTEIKNCTKKKEQKDPLTTKTYTHMVK